MPTLARRVESLEAQIRMRQASLRRPAARNSLGRARLKRRHSDIYYEIASRIANGLSDDELDLLETAHEAFRQGRSLTGTESRVVEAYVVALETACQRAGFGSIEECRRASGLDP
jgi:hypothetical protein